jgi:hypothetical protein
MVQMTDRRTRLKGSSLSKKMRCRTPLIRVLSLNRIGLSHFYVHEGDITP